MSDRAPGPISAATPGEVMTRPTRYLAWMAVGLVAAAVLAVLLHEQLYNAYRHNPGLNFGIVVVVLHAIVPPFNVAVTSTGELPSVVLKSKSPEAIFKSNSPRHEPENLFLSFGSGGPFFIISALMSSSVLPTTA